MAHLGHAARNWRYQATMVSPNTNVTAAPSARNTPNGTSRFFRSDSGPNTSNPRMAPANTVTSTPRHPTNAPTIAIILMSPPPIASSLNSQAPPCATANNRANPVAAPSSAWRNPWTPLPSRMVPNAAPASACSDAPYKRKAPSQMSPTSASTMGYCTEIGAPQRRHLPRSSSHDTMGILSRHPMRCLQCGHVDGGWISERCLGSSCHSRRMQTLRKLPKQSPRTAAPAASTASPPTQHLVEQNAGRDRDVERLGARHERNGDAPRRHGVEVRANARSLIAHDDGDRSRLPRFRFAPAQRVTVGRRGPERDAGFAAPRDERRVVEHDHGVAEGGAHRRAQRLGAVHVGGAPQRDGRAPPQALPAPDQPPHLPGAPYP